MTKLRDSLFVIILLISLLLGTSGLTRGHEWGDDFASYIMQAQSILNGNMDEFVERNAFTIFESSAQIGPVAYPWGYPLALTPVLLLKGMHALALKLPGLLFFVGFLVCLYLLTETRLTWTECLLLVSLFAFNPIFLKFLDQIITDIPFLFPVYLALVLISKFNTKHGIWRHALLGVVLFAAFFIRTTGVMLLASFLVHQALSFYQDREKRKGIILNSITVVGIFAALWVLSSLIFPNGQGAYFRQLAGFSVETLQRNIHGYLILFIQFFDSSAGIAWTYVLYMLAVFFLAGAWTQRNFDKILIIFFTLYFAVMLIWPEWQGIRFIFPLLPIFIYFALQGMRASISFFPERYHFIGQGIVILLWLVVAGIFLVNSGVRAYATLKDNRRINGPFDSYSGDMFNFIKAETPPDSVIVFFKPRAMRLFTDRDSIMALECENLLKGDYFAQHQKWEYSQILPSEIEACNLPLENIYENQRFIVYEILK